MKGWSRSSAQPSSRLAASASVRATMMPGHPHDVELEARGVQALDLFVLRHQHLAALVAAFLHARFLVLDVVSRHADLDESANQVAHMSVASMSGIGVGDDERPIVDFGGGSPLPRVMRERKKCWFLSAVSKARTMDAASSGTWLGIAGQIGPGSSVMLPSPMSPSRPDRCLRFPDA